jgi:prepilin-type processing-associated H-X9-DG protein
MSYVTNKTIFNCMEARGQSYYVGTWGDRGRLSIGLNSGLEMGEGLMPFDLGAFSDPAATIMLADSTVGSTGAPDNARGFQIKADCKPDTQSGISSRHNGGANIGFLDGHAKWYNSTRVWQSNNRAGLHWTP